MKLSWLSLLSSTQPGPPQSAESQQLAPSLLQLSAETQHSLKACAQNTPQRHSFGGAYMAGRQPKPRERRRSLGFGTESCLCAKRELTCTKLKSSELSWNNQNKLNQAQLNSDELKIENQSR